MTRMYTCILCPNGCEISVQDTDAESLKIEGNRCPKGADYVTQELRHPVRTIATSVLVRDGVLPLCSVRLTRPIPKKAIPSVMEEIKKIQIHAPVQRGQILIANIFNLDSDVITTRTVEKRK